MLETRSLSKMYGRTYAVRELSFLVRPGEVVGLLGPNGSGKSTTVNMLVGLLEPSEGTILWQGRSTHRDAAAFKRNLGYVPEVPHLYTYLSGREYLELIGDLREIPTLTLHGRIRALLDLLGLGSDGSARMSAYSKGMRQKILIAAALLDDPELLIFDEPLSGLDVTSALVFRDLVRLLAEGGKTIVYSSHALETVEKICHRVIILRQGEVAAQDSVGALRELMKLESLEDVFTQLVVHEDTASVAGRIAEAVGAQY